MGNNNIKKNKNKTNTNNTAVNHSKNKRAVEQCQAVGVKNKILKCMHFKKTVKCALFGILQLVISLPHSELVAISKQIQDCPTWNTLQ